MTGPHSMTDQHSGDRDSERARAREAYEATKSEGVSPDPVDAASDGAVEVRPPEPLRLDPDIGAIPSAAALGTAGLPGTPLVSGAAEPYGKAKVRVGDRVFKALSMGSGLFVVTLIALVAIFLLAKAVPSI